jgi:hypothetical protein
VKIMRDSILPWTASTVLRVTLAVAVSLALAAAWSVPSAAAQAEGDEAMAGDETAGDGMAGDDDDAFDDAPDGGDDGDDAFDDALGGDAGGPAATGTPGTTTTSAAPEQDAMDAGTYAVRLRDLEQRINELKEQIFRSKARLSLLAETVLQGVVAGAQVVLVHENKMSSSYKLVKVVYALDGAQIFNRADEEGELGDREQFEVYNGSIVPGEHTLTVNLEYRGHGYGIFSYLKGYRFRVRSNYQFTAPEGRGVTIRVVGYEKGGPTAPLEERPAVRYVERVQDRAESAPPAVVEDAEAQ